MQKADYRKAPSNPKAKTLFSVTSNYDVHVPLPEDIRTRYAVDNEFLHQFDSQWIMGKCVREGTSVFTNGHIR